MPSTTCLAMRLITSAATTPPTAAPAIIIKGLPPTGVTAIPATAPRPAAGARPARCGSAMWLRKAPWRAAPVVARAEPTNAPESTRGNLIAHTTESVSRSGSSEIPRLTPNACTRSRKLTETAPSSIPAVSTPSNTTVSPQNVKERFLARRGSGRTVTNRRVAAEGLTREVRLYRRSSDRTSVCRPRGSRECADLARPESRQSPELSACRRFHPTPPGPHW